LPGFAVQRDPVREWREQYARRGTQLGFKPVTDAPFRSSVRPIWDAPRIVQTRLTPGLLFRDRGMVRDGDDRLSLVLTQFSRLSVWHRGHELCLEPGDATLFQADEPGKCGSRAGLTLLEISIPQAEWSARGLRPGEFLMRQVRRNCDGLRLLGGYLRSLATLGSSASLDARELVRRHLTDLAVLAATRHRPVGESDASAVVAARLQAMKDDIEGHFRQPGLSVSAVAARHKVSVRYVQRLFERSGSTFTQFVMERRLDAAHKALTARPDTPMHAIAYGVGFNDISYFDRMFRRRFGCTPSDVRHAARVRDHDGTG
jgi:AraC-like DNA-binding protein